MVFTPTDSQTAMEDIWQSENRPICVSRERSLSGIFLQEQGRAGSRLAPLPALCVSPCHAPTPGVRANQGERMPSATRRPILDKPSLVSSPDAADEYRPVADTGEEGSPLAGKRLDLASLPGVLVPTCVGHQRVPVNLPAGVLNTITQARAPSTRRLYSSKWSVFTSWCTASGTPPSRCGVPEVLSFLQELLDKGRTPSTLKVYVAAIAAFAEPPLGQSLGRNDLVIRFLRGAKRLNPPRPPSVPVWDLSTVLEAMKGAPFEPIQSIDLKLLSFKTVFLLALASVKRIGDLQALSVSATCMEFGPNDSRVILKPKHGYVPKSLNTPFRAQVISLLALPVSEEEGDAGFLCPALVITRLDYCNALLAGLPSCATKPLQMIQYAAARLVFNEPKRAHVTPLFISLHWLPLSARIKFKALTLAYRSVTGSAPSYFHSLLQVYIPTRSLRSVNERRLVVPSQRAKKSLSRTFSFTVPCWWNDLPTGIRNAESMTTFKKELKTLLFREHLTA
ncbi:hypothetical protein PO909_014574 [Leuciscus waleckii]